MGFGLSGLWDQMFGSKGPSHHDGRPLAEVPPSIDLDEVRTFINAVVGTSATVRAVDPTSSVIIPVYNKANFTFACLRSVFTLTDLTRTEVIVVDDGSTDETQELIALFDKAIVAAKNERNLGFVDTCRHGASVARGKHLVFLNNDTIVQPGWLDALLETAEHDETVGAVGPLFLYPDGMVQEAGSIIWRDGGAHHYGWGRSPDDKRLSFAREVDYCSGACLLVRRDLFVELGGFDDRFAPGYYEDVDICFAIRAHGSKVVYQPRSRIVHFESISSNSSSRSNMKSYMQINKGKFYEKWRTVLESEHLSAKRTNIEKAAHRLCRYDAPEFISS